MIQKKKQISDYKHLKQVAVVLHPEDQKKIKEIQDGFRKRQCIGELSISSILRYGLRELDPNKIFKDQLK